MSLRTASQLSEGRAGSASAVPPARPHACAKQASLLLLVALDLEREAVRSTAHLGELTQMGRVDRQAFGLKHVGDDRVLGERQHAVVAQGQNVAPVSYTHLRAHETDSYLVCRL